jgi:hypothetical protein
MGPGAGAYLRACADALEVVPESTRAGVTDMQPALDLADAGDIASSQLAHELGLGVGLGNRAS